MDWESLPVIVTGSLAALAIAGLGRIAWRWSKPPDPEVGVRPTGVTGYGVVGPNAQGTYELTFSYRVTSGTHSIFNVSSGVRQRDRGWSETFWQARQLYPHRSIDPQAGPVLVTPGAPVAEPHRLLNNYVYWVRFRRWGRAFEVETAHDGETVVRIRAGLLWEDFHA